MESYLDQIYNLLLQKEKYVDKIYSITKDAVFLGGEGEIEPYEKFLNQRQPYFDKLNGVVKQINNLKAEMKKDRNYRLTQSSQLKKQEQVNSSLEKKINSVVEKVMDIDKKNNKYMEELYTKVQKELKNINQGKRLNDKYLSGSIASGFSIFDSKK